MKKFLALVLTLVFSLSAVSAGAKMPEQLKETQLNSSGDLSFSMTLDNADEIIAFIDTFEDFNSMEDSFFDIKNMIKSILNINGKMHVECDISEDFKKAKVAFGADMNLNVNLNENFDIMVTPRMAAWINVDFTDLENPVFDIIMQTPASSKYIEMKVFEILEEEEKKNVADILSKFYSADWINSVSSKSVAILEKYAEFELASDKCTISLDKAGAMAMVNEILDFAKEEVSESILNMSGEAEPEIPVLPDLGDLNIFGENGIVMEYTFDKNNITEGAVNADISLDVGEIYNKFYGMEWEYETELTIDISANSTAKFYDYGTTKIDFPILTDENSTDFADTLYYSGSYYDYGYTVDYPQRWFDYSPEYIPVIDSVTYVPLRQTLEAVYGDTVTITNENGTIKAVCEFFDGFTTLTLNEYSTKVYLDSTEYEIGGVIVWDGIEYVDNELFDTVLNWDIYSIRYMILSGKYVYSGYANTNYTYEETVEIPYPNHYVSIETPYLPFIGGQVYVPLRMMLESAYEDTVAIEYNDGKITASSPYFPGFETLGLTVGSDKIYAGGAEHTIGVVFEENGTTYVHPALFTDVFGWELDWLEHNILNKIYELSYDTGNYNYYFY